MVDSSQDPNGNRVEYYYMQDGQQIYPHEIRYGLHATQSSSYFSVRFGYSTNRADPFVDCRSRFASTNRLLLNNITVFFGSRRIRQYQFGYDTNAPVSLLTSVTQFGDDRSQTNNTAQANIDYLPPTHFAYTPYTLSNQPQVQTIYFDPNEPNFAFGGEGSSGNHAEFVDINHDGLPDILVNSDNQWRSLLNPGRFTNSWPLSQIITNPPPVTGVNLGQASTRLVDLRGDGRAKLMVSQTDVSPDQATAFYYYDFVSPTTLGPAQPYLTINGITLGQNEVQFVDLHDDKAMDILRVNGIGPYGFLEGLYTRPGSTNQYLTTPNTYGFDFSQGWRFADMNGDRLQDLVWPIDTDNTKVSLNLGWGNFAPPYWMSGGPSMSDLNQPGTSGPQLVDLNQDGLADLAVVENGEVRIWFNQNGVSWSGPVVITGTPAYQGGLTAVRFADINGNGSTDIIWHQGQDPFIQYVDLFPAGKAYQLNHASTTLGRSLDITYRSSTDYMSLAAGTTNQWTVVAPFPVPVISQIVEGDGLGNFYTNQFSYRNGYYDGLEREFRGFEQAVKTELGSDAQGAPTLVTRFQFDTGSTNESLKGKPLRVEADTASGQVFYRQTNFWLPRPLALTVAPGETRSVTFAFQNDKLTEVVELGAEANAVTLEEAFDYDNYGNQIFQANYGRVENGNRAAWNDERLFYRRFSAEFPSGTNLWILDRLVEQDTTDINSNVFARVQVFYDDQLYSGNNFGAVTLGNPTLTREWFSIANNTYRPTVRKEYDAFGNVTGVYDPLGTPGSPSLGHYRQIAFDTQIHTHPVTETIYTANPDIIAAGTSQPSLVMQANYDVGLGVMTSAIDFNQNTTSFSFDTFGRIVSITKPYDTTNLPTAAFTYLLQSPAASGQTINYIETDLRQVAGQSGTFVLRSFFDGMGRKLMTRTQSETNGLVVVNDAMLFNQRRSVWRSFLPYFETGTLTFNPINQTGSYVETDYDALGRQTVTSKPPTPPETYRAFSCATYGPLTRLVQDEEQTQPRSPHYGAGMFYVEDGLRNQNGQGRLRQVEEIVKISDTGMPTSTTNIWLTQYTYDTLDNFLGYTDSRGNQKAFQYDALSRKTFMNDPDRGIMQWNYDLASNVTNTFDAKGQQIVYAYDGANRLLTENYLDGNPKPSWRPSSLNSQLSTLNSVVYHHDLPYQNVPVGDGTSSTAANTLGKLAWVEDLSGEEHTSYDARGRVAYMIKRLPDLQFLYATNAGLNQPLISYRTGFAYDSLDHVVSLTYPDDDSIGCTYNNRNLLQSIQGGVNGLTRAGAILENIAYQASAQLGSIGYGNGILTQYGYDPRLRLASITTAPATNASSPLIAFGYAFDDASNIKTIYDNRPTSVVPAENPRRNTQVFGYDDLYRITSVGYALGALGVTTIDGGSISYKYDRIGNMLAQTSSISDSDPITGRPVANLGQMTSGGSAGTTNRIGRAASDPPGPHALTSISNLQSPIVSTPTTPTAT
jgi:YD repeat-containing protein